MKNILAIFMIVLFSQFSNAQQEYSNLWKEVESLEKKGLTKSAFEKVSEISKRAKRDRNNPQIIKSFLKKSSYQLTLEEDAQLTIVNDLKAEIATQSSPTKNILQSILGTIYWHYYSNNRYQFQERTKTSEKVDVTDFRTWDLQTIFKEIHLHLDASLENATQLQKLDLAKFDAILTKEKGSKTYRPTVYDFLAHNALDFYKSTENSITRPSYTFLIDDPEYLCDATLFTKMDLSTQDSLSLEAKALKIYQNLIQFHLKDKSPEALIKVNIERLYFVQQKGTFDNKTARLIEAFQNEKTTVASHPYSGMYDAETAVLYQRQASQYNPITKPEHQWSYKKALELCDGVISKFPNSVSAKKCEIIKHGIKNPILDLKTENYLPIAQVSKLLVTYKNIDNLYFQSKSMSLEEYNKFSKIYQKENRFKFIKDLASQQQWNAKLPTENDYQTHSTEVSVPKLTNGYHIIIASTTSDINDDFYAFGIVQVTNMALTHKSYPENSIFQLTDRNTGKPIANQKVEFSYSEQRSRKELTKTMTTDVTGSIVFNNEYSLRNVHVHVKNETDTAYFGNYYIYKSNGSNDAAPKVNLFFFTDRSIYRPSQTAFFKGILVKTNDEKSTVFENQKVTVTLRDANYQEVTEQIYTTNEYGSIQGEFIIPNSGLTGNFSLQANVEGFGNVGNTYISVEEYKRPKFEATFLPVKESYSVNDDVVAKGNAKAFAGSVISDAKVSYTVKRTPRYPAWAFWRRPYIQTASQQITTGETTTDAAGNFEISFKAIPDAKVDKSLLPVFDYEVSADITDINGETRSTTTTIHVGYHTLTANVYIDTRLDATKRDYTLEVSTKNLNGEKVAAKGTVSIYKLQAPDRVLRKRPWQVPDYKMISEKEFKELFPHDAYTREEENFKQWKKGKRVFNESFDTKTDSKLALGKIKRWESGKYVIELNTTDENGMAIKDIVYTDVWNKNDDFTADQKLLDVSVDKESYLPNETVVLTLASATKDMTVTVDVEKEQKIINTYIISLTDGKQQLEIPVLKADEGGFRIHCTTTIFNSIITQQIPVYVAYPASELQIETTTFRDKLKPGQEETWSFRIKGPKGEKVASELLASMYDASLDEFKSHQWQFSPLHQPRYYSNVAIRSGQSFGISQFTKYHNYIPKYYDIQSFDKLNWFGLRMYIQRGYFRSKSVLKASQRVESRGISNAISYEYNDAEETEDVAFAVAYDKNERTNFKEKDSVNYRDGDAASSKMYDLFGEEATTIVPRKNLQETAFFFPQLQTDKDGNVSFSFTTPEALTKWKLQLLTHTKALQSATKTLTTVTQKELMVLPNVPRFLREGDQISISTKISNLSDKNLNGEASLQLIDPITGQNINPALFPRTGNPTQTFSVDSNGNTQVSWTLNIPKTIQAVQYTITAKAGAFSDGEQGALPVLSNRMLVTETLPMWIRSNETKTFTLDKLATSTSSTLQHHKLSLEVTSNPAWYAVQALPYLMEYPYECAEQTFSRYYANALASHIANSNPRIQAVFNQWKSSDALLSNLEKNQELKSLLIQETPWVRDAQSEAEQKKRIALLFDLNRMQNEQSRTVDKLQQMQSSSGGFPWFSGGRDNRFITQHIIAGFGHLDKLGVNVLEATKTSNMIEKAIVYLDQEFIKEYKNIRKYNKEVDLSKDHLSYSQLHYLYMRSFFPEITKSKEVDKIMDYYKGQITKYWLNRSLYSKGLMALVSHRMNNPKTANAIIRSLKENSITSDELGMYWKANTASWYWYQAPIETQALMIEAFSEISKDITTIDNLKIWLLKNKQTNRWSTTKATSDAVYALLLQGSDWLSVTDMVDVTIGNQAISPTTLENVKVEAGTGYFKTSWNGNEVTPEMAKVTLTKKGDGIAWGGLYWQYFEDLDKITTAETSLKLSKKLFKRTYGDTGEVLTAIDENSKLELGDLIRVRIELRNDRAMEFVHMKDMRAAGLEPINVLSQYKWQDGLGYYESTKDASTNFFFDYLPKGVFVFEYDLRVNNIGEFSNGITTIQSMYAPEFSSHSEGVRIKVD